MQQPQAQENLNPEQLKQLALIQAKQKQYRKLAYELFEQNPKGKEWLEFMIDGLIMGHPTADPTKDSNHAYYREGQNSVIRGILDNVKAFKEQAKAEALEAQKQEGDK